MKNYQNSKQPNKNQEICYSSSQNSSDSTIRNSALDSTTKFTLKSSHKLLNRHQVEYYIRLLKEAELSIFSRDALIELLKQQFDHIDSLYQISLSNIEDITYKYRLTKTELDCLKKTCEKYTYDIEILIREKNEKRLSNSQKQYSKWLKQFQKINSGGNGDKKNSTDHSENIGFQDDLQDGNVNISKQHQIKNSQQFLKRLGSNSAQSTLSNMKDNQESMGAMDVEKLLKENEILKKELADIKLEHERLLNHDTTSKISSQETIEIKNLLDKVEILKHKVNDLYEKNIQMQQQTDEEIEILPIPKVNRADSVNSDSFLEVRDSLIGSSYEERGSIDPAINYEDLEKENAHLHRLILQLQQNEHNEDEIAKLTLEISHLRKLLKQKTEELLSASRDLNNLTDEDDVIQELREKHMLFQNDYKETRDRHNTLSDQLLEQTDKVNNKIALISNLQEEIKQLHIELEQKQLTNQTENENEELNEKLHMLQQSLKDSEEENKGYSEEMSKHNDCQQRIHELNVELAEKTILIAKLKSEYNNARKTKFNQEQVEYKNKINALCTENVELQNLMDERDKEINDLETVNKELTAELKTTQMDYENNLKQHDKGIDEIFLLFKNKEDEVLKTSNLVKSREENLEKLKSENGALRKLLEDKRSTLKSENLMLEQNIREQQYKSSTSQNLTEYASKINELEQLNEEYMNTIKAFSNICNLLQSKNDEVMDVKSILNVLLENMESNFCNSNNNQFSINTVQIDNMIACIRKFYKSDLNAQNTSKSNMDIIASKQFGESYTPMSNQLVKFSSSGHEDNVQDLLAKREYLHRNLKVVNDKLQRVFPTSTETSFFNCSEISSGMYLDNKNIIPNTCWIQSVDLVLKQMATDINHIKQHLMPPNYEHCRTINSSKPSQTQISSNNLQNYVQSMKRLLRKAVDILDDIGKIEQSL